MARVIVIQRILQGLQRVLEGGDSTDKINKKNKWWRPHELKFMFYKDKLSSAGDWL